MRKAIEVKISSSPAGRYGIVGHAGVGHVHSHSGFVQDDSAGFAVVSALIKKAIAVDTAIASVYVDRKNSSVTVITKAGGKGTAAARRGFSAPEAEIAQRAVGLDAAYSQNTAFHTFGRIYGQGALEAPVALQGACALAAMDSFKKVLGSRLVLCQNAFKGKYDAFAGTVLDINDIPVSVMLVVNATEGGIGPDEDLEGNTDFGAKGDLMKQLCLDKIPTAVVESKAFIPALSGSMAENQYLIRAQKGIDCSELGRAMYEAGLDLHLPVRYEDDMMPIKPGSLASATKALAAEIVLLGQKLSEADCCSDKVRIVAELNQICSEDAGGVTFMGNTVNDAMRGAGTLPGGISAVISMVTTAAYQKEVLIPQLEVSETENYIRIISGALEKLSDK